MVPLQWAMWLCILNLAGVVGRWWICHPYLFFHKNGDRLVLSQGPSLVAQKNRFGKTHAQTLPTNWSHHPPSTVPPRQTKTFEAEDESWLYQQIWIWALWDILVSTYPVWMCYQGNSWIPLPPLEKAHVWVGWFVARNFGVFVGWRWMKMGTRKTIWFFTEIQHWWDKIVFLGKG